MQGDLIKAGDLKPLSDAGLLYLVVRMAIRSEPWCPIGGEAAWREAVAALMAVAAGELASAQVPERLATTLLNFGARGCYGDAPEHLSRGRNQAASVLAMGLEAAQCSARKDRWKRVRDAGKHAASIYALQAHAGRLAIADALTLPWAAVRADIPRIAERSEPLTLAELRELGPLWPEPWPELGPAWARPG